MIMIIAQIPGADAKTVTTAGVGHHWQRLKLRPGRLRMPAH